MQAFKWMSRKTHISRPEKGTSQSFSLAMPQLTNSSNYSNKSAELNLKTLPA